MATGAVRVRGHRELMRAAARAEKESRKEIREAFRKAAEPVRAEAVERFSPIDAYSAAGYRVVVRQRGVAVESSRRKTTGTRPDYGALQMNRALLPALAANEDRIEKRVQEAIDRVADHFERGA